MHDLPAGALASMTVGTPGPGDLLGDVRAALAPRYDVLERIGEGGMAVVFRARDTRHERSVAIKVVRPELGFGSAADRFLREIRLTARLQHPNIVSLFDSGATGALVYYVMPFIEGESLRSVLEREGRLSIKAAIQLTQDLAGALNYAHAIGTVHRDLKPENILLSSGRAMLADFGIASAVARLARDDALTVPGTLVGTPTYMSPEQCSGGLAIDGRSDIYSLGCVLYEMLAAEPPFGGRTAQIVMARHVSERLPSIEVLRPDTPRHVVKAVEKALAKSPGDRFQTARDMAAALGQPPARAASRWWVAAAGAVAVALAIVATVTTGPAIDPNRVAIFPLAERQLAADERGGGAAVSVLLSTALEHTDPIRPLDMYDRLTSAQQLNPGALDPRSRRKLAREAGAAHYINGFVQGHGDSITVRLVLYSVVGDSLVDQESASGDRSTPMHRLGMDAARALLPSLVDPGRSIDLSPLRNRLAGAVALFVQGEREYRHSSFPKAAAFYRRALEQDSALIMAAIKGALSAFWEDHGAAAELAAYAVARDSLLPPRYAVFARGLHAFLQGQRDTAEFWLSRAVRAAPGWPEASMQRAEVHHHLVPARGSSDSLAYEGFRAAAADSGFSPPLIHLAEMAVSENRLGEARDLITRVRAMGPPTKLIAHLQMMYDCVASQGHDFRWKAKVETQLSAVSKAAKALSAAGRQLPCAEGGFRAVLSFGPDTGTWKWGASIGLMSLLAAQRRTADLVSMVDSISQAGKIPVLVTYYLLAAAAGLPVEKQAEAVVALAQARWGPTYAGLAANAQLQWLQWLFGVWHARRGEREIVASLSRDLAKSYAAAPHPTTRLFENALEARLRLMSHDTTNAIRLLNGLQPVVPNDSLSYALDWPFAAERLLLAELLFAQREYAQAIEVATVFDHPEPILFVAFLPASLDIRLRAAEAIGRREAAQQYRARLERLRP